MDKLLGFHQHVGFMAQGLQRDLDAAGRVLPKKEPSSFLTVRPALLKFQEIACARFDQRSCATLDSNSPSSLQEALGPEVYVFLSDVETDVWANGTVSDLSRQSAKWLVTRGEAGADEFSHGTMQHLPPYKVQPGPQAQPQ